ncbi:hypothetical protein NA56DRAFT_648114 [Hyaloscypha hepaticicola]|uniref:Uncharacterized protein n=1 Tax=Hyaloscypha hepaticicola TaxID=2082293 RepID=A0A2J6PWH3_9HELO|nr:hypothetical protein NA56DRAFT_648114 [Hyaloscypha hepaticicola]
MLSTSDNIAVSFGFASLFIAIVAVFVTRRAYIMPSSTDLERQSNTQHQFGTQTREDMVMEEMRLRRWSTVKSFESES